MLIDTSIAVACKCDSCGSFEFSEISLFRLKENRKLLCRCKNTYAEIKQENNNGFIISLSCIGCGNGHTYSIERKCSLLKHPVAFNCPETGIQICFAGRDEIVRKKVDYVEEKLDDLIDMYGYESYFYNTRVMFDVLNCIHDIALEGNLCCECGSMDVELVFMPDCILLQCVICGSDTRIYASRNKDLKEVRTMDRIFIKGKGPQQAGGRKRINKRLTTKYTDDILI